MSFAPIAVFTYNRPDHFRRMMDAIAHNAEAASSRLFVFSDAPKDATAAKRVAQVRSRAHGIKGFRSVEVIEQETNQGIANSIIAGVADMTNRFGGVIVLEDDLLPSVHFLQYMNDALRRYASDDRVISVHAYAYPVTARLPETFFLRGADCWGWATWKRGWDLFEPSGRKLLTALEERRLTQEFDFDGAYPYTQMLCDCIEGKNDSWAIRWYASAFLQGKLTLYPGSSQVQNIGADGSGIHVGSTRLFEHAEWGRGLSVDPIPVEESVQARRAFAGYLAQLRPSMAARVFRRFKQLVSTPAS